MDDLEERNIVVRRFVSIRERAAFIIFILLSFYGFFPLGIESGFFIGIIRIVILGFFIVFVVFRGSRKEAEQRETEEQPEKEPEKDVEIIQKLSDYRIRKKQVDTRKGFDSYVMKILEIIQDSFIAHSVLLMLNDQEKNELMIKASVSKSSFLKKNLSLPLDTEFADVVFKGENTVIFQDNTIAEYEEKIYTEKENLSSMICSPVFISGEIVGCLVMDSKIDKAFSEDDKKMIESYSEVISSTIVNYNNLYEHENTIDLFSAFYEISKKLNSNLSFDEILDVLVNILKEIVAYDRISVSLLENSRNEAVIKRVIGQKDEFEENYRFSVEEGLNGWVIRKNKPILVADLEKGDYFIPRYTVKEKSNHYLRSFVAAPINYGNSCFGVVSVECRKPNTYTDRHERLLSLLANNIGIALDRSMMYTELENLATTDGLTGVNNYRNFRRKLTEEMERAKRYNVKFSMLMLDIDKFKDFNDRYGHLVGDHILKNSANVIKQSVRTIDFVARYGGEEFSVILVEADMDDAKLTAERIRKNIQDSAIEYNDGTYSVTISIGISEYTKDIKNEDELIGMADKALYQAKAEGRNRVVCHSRER